ncbi:hypothetical protein DPMN_144393 [Dreissena polymorpha]|uniref:S-formylglutathione hydrolase n=1 Tax=Dreissena polymorpha TaxID=45954 RepID=A0A9D4GET9_DREPO|nr:hypothetical protein DPMN_144393 [Dreissena polymorpha]
MGGYVALICALKNTGKFQSVSAFAPISNPIKAPWGIKALTGYLGGDQSKWQVSSECISHYLYPYTTFSIFARTNN